ncbi:MAG TPA: hypothetical protein PLQ20_00520 [Candidatus Paceibacterota bacterium]|nr:hypothetical protein [Candidatus Paceibacterota bacterium]
MKKILTIFIFLTIFAGKSTYAQLLPEDISISLFPNNPKPGQIISATVESFGVDLSRVKVSWYYNDKLIASGIGKTETKITSPAFGQKASLLVRVSGGGSDSETSVVISSSELDIIWEAVDSYTPPFYKGKALAPIGTKIKAVAVPSVGGLKNLSYTWSHNGSVIKALSGTNKDSLTIKTDALSQRESFSASVSGGTFEGQGEASLDLRDPSAVLYAKSNGFVDYANGFTNLLPINSAGLTLRIEPFNITVGKNISDSLDVSFDIEGEVFRGEILPQELAITKPENPGQSSLKINISSLKEKLQVVKRAFTLSF